MTLSKILDGIAHSTHKMIDTLLTNIIIIITNILSYFRCSNEVSNLNNSTDTKEYRRDPFGKCQTQQ